MESALIPFRIPYSLRVLLLVVFWCFLAAKTAWANPYFFVSGDAAVITGTNYTYTVRVNTDGDTITAAQAVLVIPTAYFTPVSVSISNSNCSLWTPANSVPPGENTSKTTPYVYNGNVIFTCGFSNPGYNAADGIIGKVVLTPHTAGSADLAFATTSGYNKFFYIGTEITPGAMSDYTVTITGAGQPTSTPTPTATPTSGGPTNTPTPTPTATNTPTATVTPTPGGPTSTPTTGSSSSSSSSYSLSAGDVTFVTIAPLPTKEATDLPPLEDEITEQDNTIPAAVNITPRPTPSPYPTPAPPGEEDGEVLAVQSIRELLIPGRSAADKTVVMINFISVLSLLTLMAIVTWRLITSNHAQKLKTSHLKELVSGELSTLESKLSVLGEKEGKQEFQSEFNKAIDSILNELQGENPKKGG